VEDKLRHAITQARAVKRNKGIPEYSIVGGKISVKFLDGVRRRLNFKYQFLAIREWEKGNLDKEQMLSHLKLYFSFASISNAELPYEYDIILGVTGTLRDLSESHRFILTQQYAINNYFFIPSVYGENRRTFDSQNPRDVRPCEDKASFFVDLRDEILRRRHQSRVDIVRPVLVFFDKKSTLLEFYEWSQTRGLKAAARTITEVETIEERQGLFEKATEQGAITLMIREHGRGTDFQIFDETISQEGGAHVIQAFFSIDRSEEVQIQGRCARQGKRGSFR